MDDFMEHEVPIVPEDFRLNLNDFAAVGHSRAQKHEIGLKLATRIYGVQFGELAASLTDEQVEELYDRVLFNSLPTPTFHRPPELTPMDVMTRHEFLAKCDHDRVGTPKDIDGDEEVMNEVNAQYEDTEEDPSTVRADVSSDIKSKGYLPLLELTALVLDSGRGDGVTEACCLELARHGARVAVACVGNDSKSCDAMARSVCESIQDTTGAVIPVSGIPYRSGMYTDYDSGGARYIRQIIEDALDWCNADEFQVIGK